MLVLEGAGLTRGSACSALITCHCFLIPAVQFSTTVTGGTGLFRNGNIAEKPLAVRRHIVLLPKARPCPADPDCRHLKERFGDPGLQGGIPLYPGFAV